MSMKALTKIAEQVCVCVCVARLLRSVKDYKLTSTHTSNCSTQAIVLQILFCQKIVPFGDFQTLQPC